MTFTVRHSGVMTATARTRRGATLAIAARAMSVAIVVSIAMFSSAILSAAFPKPDGVVTDLAAVLTPAAKADIESRIREVEQRTTAEVAVAIVSSLDGLTVEDYASRLFQQWGIGQKASDNGVLILVAPAERKIRIEVGYGLEPILPDGLAGEIIRNQALPAFRNGDYPQGLTATVQRVAAIIEANQTVTPAERRRLAADAEDRPPMLLMLLFFGVFIAIGGFAIGMGFRVKAVFPMLFGGLFGGLPFLMTLAPFFNAPPWILGPFGLAMMVVGYRKGEGFTDIARGSRTGSALAGAGSPSTGWVLGGDSSSSISGSGSSSSSSSSSSDGFSGGSSGGGGASGSW